MINDLSLVCIHEEKIISCELVNGRMEIVKKIIKHINETVQKEIYGTVDGKIQLIAIIDGEIIPRQVIEESYVFNS